MRGGRSESSEAAWFVSSVEKAFVILRAFEAHERSLSLTEIAEITQLDKSSVQRFTYTLAALGYLRKDQDARRYTISPKIMSLGMIYLRTDPIVVRARNVLYELNKSLDVTTNLAELDGSDVIYVVRFPGRKTVTVDVVLGMRRPAYCMASGRAILATLSDDEVRDILERSNRVAYTSRTKTGVSEIMDEINKTRERGYAITEQETVMGDISIAAPVRRPDGTCTAAVNMSVSTADWDAKKAAGHFSPVVIEAARAVSGSSELRPFTFGESAAR